MNAHTGIERLDVYVQRMADVCSAGGGRLAIVRHEKSWLRSPLEWALRIRGMSVGGYGYIDGLTSGPPDARYATREQADRAAAVWVETGITPAFQTDERPAATVTPFPDPEGEDRDARRLTTWDFTR